MPGGKPDPLIARRHGLIGAPVSRLDGPLKVQGQARFAAEFPMQDMVYAALVYSTVPRGRIAAHGHGRGAGGARRGAGDDARERTAHEAHAALHVQGQGGRRRRPARAAGRPGPLERPAGRRGAGAQTQEQADHAKSLVRVSYDSAPATTSFAAAKAKGTKPGTSRASR
jgi:xanthine dehydrogenase YagR molybdenum-binding subunit